MELYYYNKQQVIPESVRIIKTRTSKTICMKYNRRYTIYGYVKDNEVHFGYAVCAPNDQFIKKIGREIAKSNALTKPCLITPYNGEFRQIFYETAKELTDELNDYYNFKLTL